MWTRVESGVGTVRDIRDRPKGSVEGMFVRLQYVGGRDWGEKEAGMTDYWRHSVVDCSRG